MAAVLLPISAKMGGTVVRLNRNRHCPLSGGRAIAAGYCSCELSSTSCGVIDTICAYVGTKWPPSISFTNSGLIFARHQFADASVLLDIGPFANQIEMVGIGGVSAQHAVFDLCPRPVERVGVAVIELVEQLDKLIAAPSLHAKIVNMKVVALGRQWYECHSSLLSRTDLPIATRAVARAAIRWVRH